MSTHKPIKKFGQNFLKSESIVSTILDSAHISKNDTVIEIGPGYGILTFEIARRAKKVYAIEKDRDLAEFLRNELQKQGITHADIIESDIRDISVSRLITPPERYILIGNIPYYITGLLFRKFLEEETRKPDSIIFMIQKEVAERIVSQEPKHSLLSISVQAYGTPRIITLVPRSFFSPSPNVDSAVISVSDISDALFKKYSVSEKRFFETLRAGFAHPRKLLTSNLFEKTGIEKKEASLLLEKLGLKKEARAGELSVEQWFHLAGIINQKADRSS